MPGGAERTKQKLIETLGRRRGWLKGRSGKACERSLGEIPDKASAGRP